MPGVRQTLASHHRGPGLIPVHPCGLCGGKVTYVQVFLQALQFPLSMSFHKCSILTKSSITNSIFSATERQTQSNVQNRKVQEVGKKLLPSFKILSANRVFVMMLFQNISRLIKEIICCSRIVHRQLFSMFTFYSSLLLWLSIHPSP